MMLNAGAFGGNGRCPQSQNIVEQRRPEITHVRLRHHEKNAGFFQLAIGMPCSPQQLHAAQFQPCQVIGVVNPPLAIGLLIADADLNFVFVIHSGTAVSWQLAGISRENELFRQKPAERGSAS